MTYSRVKKNCIKVRLYRDKIWRGPIQTMPGFLDHLSQQPLPYNNWRQSINFCLFCYFCQVLDLQLIFMVATVLLLLLCFGFRKGVGNAVCVLFGSLLPAACFAFHSPWVTTSFCPFSASTSKILQARRPRRELFLKGGEIFYHLWQVCVCRFFLYVQSGGGSRRIWEFSKKLSFWRGDLI